MPRERRLSRHVTQTVSYTVTVCVRPVSNSKDAAAAFTPQLAEELAGEILAEAGNLYTLVDQSGVIERDGRQYRWSAHADDDDHRIEATGWVHAD